MKDINMGKQSEEETEHIFTSPIAPFIPSGVPEAFPDNAPKEHPVPYKPDDAPD